MAQLMAVVYEELRRIARRQMRGERDGHTLQTTAVVHEAFLKLVETAAPLEDRAHFFAVASRAMRQVLVDHARAHNRDKRGGGAARLPLDETMALATEPPRELLDLDDALEALGRLDERQARLVDLHFFGGLSYDKIAELHGLSRSTVNRELRLARAFLRRALAAARSR